MIFLKSQLSVSMLIRKEQKEGHVPGYEARQDCLTYCRYTMFYWKGSAISFKYLFSIYYVQDNEQGSGRRVSQKNNFTFTSWPTQKISSRLRDQVNKTGEKPLRVYKRGSKKFTFMLFYKAHLILNLHLYLTEMSIQMPT